MRRRVRDVAHIVALVGTGGLAVFFFAVAGGAALRDGATSFLFTTGGRIGLACVGVVLLLAASRFVTALADDRLHATTFSRRGEWGEIAVTPRAVEELVGRILAEEIGLSRFSVSLRHRNEDVAMTVTTTLSPDERVSEVGERIQRELVRQVSDRIGVGVCEVSVLVRGFRREAARDANDAPHAAGSET